MPNTCTCAHSNAGNSKTSGNGSKVPELLVGSTESRIGESEAWGPIDTSGICNYAQSIANDSNIPESAPEHKEQSKMTGCPILTIGNM